MRNALCFLALIASTTRSFAQGPITDAVRGAADYSDGVSVGIPRGSIFTITGSSLAPSSLSAPALPLPKVLNGAIVRVWDAATDGSVLVECPLWYVSPTQINAILPSSLTTGQHYVSVLVGASETGRLPIIATNGRFAAFSQGGRGFGPAVVQRYDATGAPFLNKLTTAAPPGSTLVLWGTGLGALASGSDADAPQAGTIRTDVTVYVDGIPATPVYAGRAPGLPGVDQINFTLPSGVMPRCFVPLQAATGNITDRIVTIAVSAGSSTCPSEFGLSPDTLASIDAGGVARAAVLRMTSSTSHTDGTINQSAEAWEAEYDTSYLSVLATTENPPEVHGATMCSRSAVDRTYGLGALPGSVPIPSITGPAGCSWSFAVAGNLAQGFAPAGCTASSYRFGPGTPGVPSSGAVFDVSGTFPSPRSSGAITGFSSQRSSDQLIVSWSVNPSPSDAINFEAGSSYTPPKLFGQSQTISIQLTCQANVADSPFVFPQTDLTWALQYSTSQVSMSLVGVTDQAFAVNSRLLDFVLVRTSNSVQATIPFQ